MRKYQAPPLMTVATGADGKFTFSDVPPGTYFIKESSGRRDNLESPYTLLLYQYFSYACSAIVSDSDVDGLEIFAVPKASISGRVYDPSGNPLANAVVFAQRGGGDRITNEDGSYSFPCLSVSREGDGNLTFVFAIHPDYGSARSKEFYYKKGESIEDVDITLGETVEISGRVTDREGNPLPKAVVQYTHRGFHDELQAAPVNSNGEYKIDKAPRETMKFVVSAAGFVEQERFPKYREGTKKAKEDFVLMGLDEERKYQISGITLDRNGNPMRDVRIQYNASDKGLRNTIDAEETRIDAEGRFVCSSLDPAKTYFILAQSSGSPVFKRELFFIPPGTDDLVIQFTFEPVVLSVVADDRQLPETYRENAVRMLHIYRNGQYQIPCESRSLSVDSSQDVPERVSIDSPGIYTVVITQKNPHGTARGQMEITIDSDTPKMLPVSIPLVANEDEQQFWVVGRCTTDDGEIVRQPYRVYCRMLEPQSGFLSESNVQKSPSPLEGLFTIEIPYDGIYEFIYIDRDGRIFGRTIASLQRSDAAPWDETPSIVALSLPDVIYSQ